MIINSKKMMLRIKNIILCLGLSLIWFYLIENFMEIEKYEHLIFYNVIMTQFF